MTRQEFFSQVDKLIPENSKILHSITLAQALVESADEKGVVANSSLTRYGNALFGIKATKNWKGKVMVCKTFEIYPEGKWTGKAGFRAYNSWVESVIDHDRFLTVENPVRYAKVIGETDYKKAAYAIKAAGYATYPTYAEKLIQIIETYKLYQYDKSVPKQTAYKDSYIKLGTHSDMGAAVQIRLNVLGYREGTADGNISAGSSDAIKRFQRDNGLTADGIVGATTLAKLFEWRT